MELEKNLIRFCKQKKLSLSTLAKLSGVRQSTLHGWSTGRSVHNLDDLKKVCTVLEVGLHSLLYGKSDPYESQAELLREVFSGEVRITIHKIKKQEEE